MRQAPVERMALLLMFVACIPATGRADDVPPPPTGPHATAQRSPGSSDPLLAQSHRQDVAPQVVGHQAPARAR